MRRCLTRAATTVDSRLYTPSTLLASFHYARNWNLDEIQFGKLIGDSGAYSARTQGVKVSIDELGEWAIRWRHRLFWVAALDVAGDQKTTRRNWEAMNRAYGLQSVPSIHAGDDPRMLDYYAERGCDFIGLGGLAGGMGSNKAGMRWLIQVFKYAKEAWPGMRFHGWGLTTGLTSRLPFWSVDSSSWGSGYRYGMIPLRDPRTRKRVPVRTNGRDAYEPGNARLLTRYYKTRPSEVAVNTAATRERIAWVCALTQTIHETRMRELHGPIAAPSWGLMNANGCPTDGPHVALADAHPGRLGNVSRLIGVHGPRARF